MGPEDTQGRDRFHFRIVDGKDPTRDWHRCRPVTRKSTSSSPWYETTWTQASGESRDRRYRRWSRGLSRYRRRA